MSLGAARGPLCHTMSCIRREEANGAADGAPWLHNPAPCHCSLPLPLFCRLTCFAWALESRRLIGQLALVELQPPPPPAAGLPLPILLSRCGPSPPHRRRLCGRRVVHAGALVRASACSHWTGLTFAQACCAASPSPLTQAPRPHHEAGTTTPGTSPAPSAGSQLTRRPRRGTRVRLFAACCAVCFFVH